MPYTYREWLRFPSPITSERTRTQPLKRGVPKWWAIPTKAAFGSMQPSKIGNNNCTALYLWNIRTPFWVKFPCNAAVEDPLVICEYGRNNHSGANVTVTLQREKLECPDGWFYINKTKRGRKDRGSPLCLTFLSFHMSMKTFSLTNNVSVADEIRLATKRNISRVQNFKYIKLYFPLVYGREDMFGIWMRKRSSAKLEKEEMCFHPVNTKAITWYHSKPEPLCKAYLPMRRNIVVLEEIPEREGNSACFPGHFHCADGTCILNIYQCDGETQCADASDETGCQICQMSHSNDLPSSKFCQRDCMKPDCTCSWYHFHCLVGGCVVWSKVCDYKLDCLDGSDEYFCHLRYDPRGRFMRKSSHKEYLYHGVFLCDQSNAIPVEMVNDLVPDCRHNQHDEYLHDVTHFQADFVRRASEKCWSSNLSSCGEGSFHCFPLSALCIYQKDANDDIKYCRTGAHLLNCQTFECPRHFKCPLSYCIPLHVVCNGIFDCPNGEEETNCDTSTCKGLFKCMGDNACLHPYNIMDGLVHCPRGMDDEQDYQTASCPDSCVCKGYLVDCSQTAISVLPLFPYSLKFLNISQTNLILNSSSFRNLNYLLVLDLSKNKLQTLPHHLTKNLTNLIFLYLQDNSFIQIKGDCFRGLQNLRYIYIKGNPTRRFDVESFEDLKELRNLDLSNLSLEALLPNTFRSLSKCMILNLSDNALNFLDRYIFLGLSRLLILDLKGNPINRVHPDVFSSLSEQTLLQLHSAKFCCLLNVSAVCTSDTNIPNFTVVSSCYNFLPSSALRTTLWILTPITFVSNIVSFLWRISHTTSQFLQILYMGQNLSDSLNAVALFCILYIETASGGTFAAEYESQLTENFPCILASLLGLMSYQMSLVFSILLSSYRCLGIRFPFRLKDLQSIKGVSFFVAICFLITALLPCLLDKCHGFCTPLHAYHHCTFLIPPHNTGMSASYICFAVTNFLLTTLFVGVNTASIEKLVKRNSEIPNRNERKTNAAIGRILISMACTCVGQLALYSLIVLIAISRSTTQITVGTIWIVAAIPSLLNPIIYTYMSSDFIASIGKQL